VKRQRIIFMGEKPLGLHCLRLLRSVPEAEVLAVCTRTKGEHWWGRQEIVDYCADESIPVITRPEILTYGVDHLISVLYPFVVEPEYIRHARRGCFNLHEAPLPRWRGCNNYSHAILAGDCTYGTTMHEMAPELDAGRIIAQRTFAILPGETARELYERTSHESRLLAAEWFPKLCRGDYTPYAPENGEPSFLNRRDSLAELKALPLTTPLARARIIAAALDFVPWEPAYVLADDRKYYLFIEASLGRAQSQLPSAAVLDGLPTLADIPWGTFEIAVIEGSARRLCICTEEIYRRHFPRQGQGAAPRGTGMAQRMLKGTL
jgi:methionyl-tRNA formyltransferase